VGGFFLREKSLYEMSYPTRSPSPTSTFERLIVMPGLVPGIHLFAKKLGVDGRDKPGHDRKSRAPVQPKAIMV
jgi:hypothetical protein